jgi:hypothetical protein
MWTCRESAGGQGKLLTDQRYTYAISTAAIQFSFGVETAIIFLGQTRIFVVEERAWRRSSLLRPPRCIRFRADGSREKNIAACLHAPVYPINNQKGGESDLAPGDQG